MKTIRCTIRSRPTDQHFSFSIRTIFSLTFFWAFMFWKGTFVTVAVAASTMGTYFILAAISHLLAGSTKRDEESSISVTNLPAHTLPLVAVGYIVILMAWHFLVCYMWLDLEYFWHNPVIGTLNLTRIEHAVLAAFNLLIFITYICRSFIGERFSRRHCFDTAALMNLLAATHFTIP